MRKLTHLAVTIALVVVLGTFVTYLVETHSTRKYQRVELYRALTWAYGQSIDGRRGVVLTSELKNRIQEHLSLAVPMLRNTEISIRHQNVPTNSTSAICLLARKGDGVYMCLRASGQVVEVTPGVAAGVVDEFNKGSPQVP